MNEISKNTPTIQTERLILRRFTEDDAEALYQILSDKEVNTYLPMFPLKELQEAKEYLKSKYLDKYKELTGYHYAICLRTDPKPIGYIQISDGDSHDLGYGLRKEYWHKGIVSEAAQALIDEVKGKIPYLTATHDVDNPRSGKVMEKIGMTYRYSYHEQWQPKNILVTFRMYQINLDGQQDRVYLEYWDKYSHFVEDKI